MFATYAAVLRAPGALRFCLTGFVMRVSIAIYPVALVLLVALRTHEYAFGGYLAAAHVIGNGLGNPVMSRWADRAGQRATLVPASIVHAATIGVLLLLVELGAPRLTWLLPAFVAGFAYVSVGALVRARWIHLLGSGPSLSTALSLESTLDEVIFVTGPLLATLLATAVTPLLPLVLAPLLVLGGAIGLHRLRTSEPPVVPPSRHGHRPLPRAPMVTLVLTLVATGMTFGAVELAAVAFVGQADEVPWTGAVVACFACGSAISGLVYGARHRRHDVVVRFRRQAVLFGLLPVLLTLAPDVPLLAVAMLVVGVGTAPFLIEGFGLVERFTPAGRLTEALAWMTTGLGLGYGVTAPVVGVLADAHGARVALLVPVATALAALALGLLTVRSTRRHLADVADHEARARHGGPGAPAWDHGDRAALP